MVPNSQIVRAKEIPVHVAVVTHCQINEHICSNREIHVLF